MEQDETFLSMYLLPALLIPLPIMLFTTQEITGGTTDAAKAANKGQRNPPSCFFLCFAVSVTPSINTPKSSNDSLILII